MAADVGGSKGNSPPRRRPRDLGSLLATGLNLDLDKAGSRSENYRIAEEDVKVTSADTSGTTARPPAHSAVGPPVTKQQKQKGETTTLRSRKVGEKVMDMIYITMGEHSGSNNKTDGFDTIPKINRRLKTRMVSISSIFFISLVITVHHFNHNL